MRLEDIDFTAAGFNPVNTVHRVSGAARGPVLDELAALAGYASLQAFAATIPPALKDARAHLKTQQQAYDDQAVTVEGLATALREARAAVELIPIEDRADRAVAEQARREAEEKHVEAKAVLDQARGAHLRKAAARVENIEALQAAIKAIRTPEAPLLRAALDVGK